MPAPPIQLSEAWFDAREADRIARALAGRVAGNGPFCLKVEARLKRLLDDRRVLLTPSCPHAMELALLALGVGPGDEVVCPSFTFVSTANAVLRVGARPVFADIEDRTLGLDPADAARRISPRTVGVLPVHYAGIAADMARLLDLARSRRLKVVEDAAHGLGASFGGRPLGTLGDAGCFSFHETKNVTCGEGGAVTFADAGVAERAEVIRGEGTNRSAFLRGEVDKYTWVAEGSSYVLSDVLAAMLDAQLDKLEEIQVRRAPVASRYREELEAWAHAHQARLPPIGPGRQGNDHLFYVLLRDEETRDRCLAGLRARGVMASFHYVPLHSSPYGRSLGPTGELPVTDRVARTLVRLPLHPRLSEGDVDRVVVALKQALP